MVLPSQQTATYSLTCLRYLLLVLPLLPSPAILAIEAILTTTTFVSDAIHFTWATLSTDISLCTGATLGNTHYSA